MASHPHAGAAAPGQASVLNWNKDPVTPKLQRELECYRAERYLSYKLLSYK